MQQLLNAACGDFYCTQITEVKVLSPEPEAGLYWILFNNLFVFESRSHVAGRYLQGAETHLWV